MHNIRYCIIHIHKQKYPNASTKKNPQIPRQQPLHNPTKLQKQNIIQKLHRRLHKRPVLPNRRNNPNPQCKISLPARLPHLHSIINKK